MRLLSSSALKDHLGRPKRMTMLLVMASILVSLEKLAINRKVIQTAATEDINITSVIT
jgi:hypothetical protein